MCLDPDYFVHPKAEVHDDCSIGAGTKVWQFASVIRGARIGENCSIASGSCIDGSIIGDRTVIAHNLAMGPGFKVGNDCFIGPNVTFCNDAFPRAHKEGFDADAYSDGRFAVIMKDGASVGAGAVILPGVVIGERAMIAANAIVSRDVPPDTLWLGQGVLRPVLGVERVRYAKEPAYVA